jgi:tRNA pseudouridine38-40 synthase
MRNIKLTIRYDGTEYSGWQFQRNSRMTIQAILQRAIKKITGEHSHVTGSGRTDAGVHAMAQIANFKTHSKIPLKNIQLALNSILPDDIVIYDAQEADAKFDAQRSAVSKLYRYTIMNADYMDPFIRRYAAKIFYTIDISLMKKAAKHLVGRHDFRAFQAVDGVERNSVRTVKYITIRKRGDLITIDIEADGFLYNMVRNIAGTLVEVGRGKFTVASVATMLRKKDRRLSGPTMPAKGLTLIKVRY